MGTERALTSAPRPQTPSWRYAPQTLRHRETELTALLNCAWNRLHDAARDLFSRVDWNRLLPASRTRHMEAPDDTNETDTSELWPPIFRFRPEQKRDQRNR